MMQKLVKKSQPSALEELIVPNVTTNQSHQYHQSLQSS
jgi:hypothetical protein